MAGISDTLDHSADDGGAWPALADLLAASTLIFLVLFAAIAIPALQRAAQRETALDEIENRARSVLGGLPVEVERIGTYVRLRITGDATFPSGKDQLPDLAAEGREILRRFGTSVMRDSQMLDAVNQIHIVGHASLEGDSLLNWRLSATRAATIAHFLIVDDSVRMDPCKVTALGRSMYYPVNPNRRADVDLRDRRIEIELHPVVRGDQTQTTRLRQCRR